MSKQVTSNSAQHRRQNARGRRPGRLYPVWQAALDALPETGSDYVSGMDIELLELIASKVGWTGVRSETNRKVMEALNRTPGRLKKFKFVMPHRGIVSLFFLENPGGENE